MSEQSTSIPFHDPRLVGPVVLSVYGALYLAVTQAIGVGNMGAINRLLGRRK